MALLSRAIDVASLVFILGGGALYLRAYVGMEAVRKSTDVVFVPGVTEIYGLTNQYLRLQHLSYVGLVLVGAGIAVGLSAAVHHHRIRRQQMTTPQTTE